MSLNSEHLSDTLVDIAKKLEKTNILLARIENAVLCLEESTKPKPLPQKTNANYSSDW